MLRPTPRIVALLIPWGIAGCSVGPLPKCENGQTLIRRDDNWQCEIPATTVPACADGQILRAENGRFSCAAAPTPLPQCQDGQVARFASGAWTCADEQVPTPHVWSTMGDDAFRPGGQVGVGTSDPMAKMHVVEDATMLATESSAQLLIEHASGPALELRGDGDGPGSIRFANMSQRDGAMLFLPAAQQFAFRATNGAASEDVAWFGPEATGVAQPFSVTNSEVRTTTYVGGCELTPNQLGAAISFTPPQGRYAYAVFEALVGRGGYGTTMSGVEVPVTNITKLSFGTAATKDNPVRMNSPVYLFGDADNVAVSAGDSVTFRVPRLDTLPHLNPPRWVFWRIDIMSVGGPWTVSNVDPAGCQ